MIDIRIGCSMIHIRSYSDSALALIELLKYILTEGDLQQANKSSRSSTPIERKQVARSVRISTDDATNNDNLEAMILLAEAMREEHHRPLPTTSDSVVSDRTPFDDDEDEMPKSHTSDLECGTMFSSSDDTRDDDSPSLSRRQGSSGDNFRGFEMIERKIGICRPPKNGLCEVHVLSVFDMNRAAKKEKATTNNEFHDDT